MNHVSFSGPAAVVRWGYHRAAELGTWTMESAGDGYKLTAQLQTVDAYQIDQMPLTFVVPRGDRPDWKWPITSSTVNGSTFTADLGPSE
ncbi:MAG: hypothetical protein V4529_17570 [Gemmatimonadota bacterium]